MISKLGKRSFMMTCCGKLSILFLVLDLHLIFLAAYALNNCPAKSPDGSNCYTNGQQTWVDCKDRENFSCDNGTALARNVCCKNKKCLLACSPDSPALEGFPENMELLFSLDPEFAKTAMESKRDEALELDVFKRSDSFEKLLAKRLPQMSQNQVKRALKDYQKVVDNLFFDYFPKNFRLLWRINKSMFKTMPAALKKQLLCNGNESIAFKNDIQNWKVYVGVHRDYYLGEIRKPKHFVNITDVDCVAMKF